MKKTITELKDLALSKIDGKWGGLIVVTLIYYVFSIVISTVSQLFLTFIFGAATSPNDPATYIVPLLLGVITALLIVPINYGMIIIFLDNYRTREHSLSTYKEGFNGRIIGTMILQNIYIILWSFLLLIPGIIKALSYFLTPYVLKDNPHLSYNAAIEESMRLMDGNKTRLFWLMLSFLGWAILCIFTCGLGMLALIPYMYTTVAAFYEEVKGEVHSA